MEIRPIWHQKTDRVLAHILVCFLAYVLWKTLGQWMQRSGLGDAPRTLLEELSKIKSGDVVFPTRTKDGRYNGTVRLRCVTEPDEAQKVLLHRLTVLESPCHVAFGESTSSYKCSGNFDQKTNVSPLLSTNRPSTP